MKKIIIIFLYFFITLNLYSQQVNNKVDSLLKNKVFSFIDTINKFYINYDEHAIFVIKSIDVDTNKNFCISMSFILNAYDYKYVEPTYFFKYKNNMILISLKRTFDISIFKTFLPEKIDVVTKSNIMNKLCPWESSATYEPPGLLICRFNNNLRNTFFENADEIPMNKSIYKIFPEGGTIIKVE